MTSVAIYCLVGILAGLALILIKVFRSSSTSSPSPLPGAETQPETTSREATGHDVPSGKLSSFSVPANDFAAKPVLWEELRANHAPTDMLELLCRRRGQLLETNGKSEPVLKTLTNEITNWHLFSRPQPSKHIAAILTKISQEFIEVIQRWEIQPREGDSGRSNEFQLLDKLLTGCQVKLTDAFPLPDYLFVVQAASANRQKSTKQLTEAAESYLKIASGVPGENFQQSSLGLRTTLKDFATRWRDKMGDYEDLQDGTLRLNRVDVLNKALRQLQQDHRSDRGMPRFEAELSAFVLSETVAFLKEEFRRLRGKPKWIISILNKMPMAIDLVEPIMVDLCLHDEANMRPARLSVIVPDSVADTAASVRYVTESARKDFQPQKQSMQDFLIPVPIRILEFPSVASKFLVSFAFEAEWEDHGFSGREALAFKCELDCFLQRPPYNPYTAGRGGHALEGDSSLFTGRTDLMREILANTERESTSLLLIWGLSRSGKSSILNRLGFLVREHAVVVHTAADIEGKIPGEYAGALKRRMQEALERSKIHLGPKNLEQSSMDKKTPLSELFGFIARVENLLEEEKKYILVTLDEYHELQLESGNRDETLHMLKTVFDRPEYSRLIKFVLAGTFSPSQLEKAQSPWREVLGGRMIQKRVDLFRDDEAGELITKHSKGVGITWPDEMVKAAIHLTGGHPFLLNLLCYYVVQETYSGSNHSLKVNAETICHALDAWNAESGGGIDDLKFCYSEPSPSWITHGVIIIEHVLSALSEREHASCLDDLPAWHEADVSDHLRRHFPTVPIAKLDLTSAFDELVKRHILRRDSEARFAIRIGMLDYALRRQHGRFETFLRDHAYV